MPAYRSHTINDYDGPDLSASIDKPAGTVENDVIIFPVYLEPSVPQTFTWPDGFTEIINVFNNDSTEQTCLGVAWKRAGASEPASYTVSWTSNVFHKELIAAYSDAATVEDSDSNPVLTQGTSMVNPSVTAITENTLLVCIPVEWQGGTWGSFGNLTLRTANSGVILLLDEDISATGATGTRTIVCPNSGGRIGSSILIAGEEEVPEAASANLRFGRGKFGRGRYK